jgi:hypothetical protein
MLRSRLASVAGALVLAATALLEPGAPVMAQTTQTIIVQGSYTGTNSGGPYTIKAGTSEIELYMDVTDAPPGANFTFTGYTSSDGGATWQERVFLSCPGGTVVTKQGVTQDASCSAQMGIDLDPSLTYKAKYTEHSDVTIQGNATLTVF